MPDTVEKECWSHLQQDLTAVLGFQNYFGPEEKPCDLLRQRRTIPNVLESISKL